MATPSREEQYEAVKAAIGVAADALPRDAAGLHRLTEELEPLNPTERCATSPLLDGYWEQLHCSEPAAWARGGRVLHAVESWSAANSPGAPWLLYGPGFRRWGDVSDGRGAYVQRVRRRFGSSEVRATFTWLGGDDWDLAYVSRSRLLLGVPLWRRAIKTPLDVDLDHALRPTFVDGDLCILRAPAVRAGPCELRGERTYLLRRMRNRLWQMDGTFKGLSDSSMPGVVDP